MWAVRHGYVPISIHALRKESDDRGPGGRIRVRISIHALRKESDLRVLYRMVHRLYFNPRSP